MELNEILQKIENVTSEFNCEVCKQSNETISRIKQCGHVYCNTCILLIDTCSKCGIKFVSDDVFIDYSFINILKSINSLKSALCYSNISSNSKLEFESVNSLVVETSGHNTSTHSQIVESDIIDNKCFTFNCLCSDCFEIREKTNAADNVDKKNAVGETKLHRACKKNNLEGVKQLLNLGAVVNAQDYAAWTPLHEAVIVGNVEIIQALIEKGSIVNAPGLNYDTPLHKAILYKHVEIAKILVQTGANLHSMNYEGNSPWSLADSDMRFALKDIKQGSEHVQMPICPEKCYIFILGEETEELKENIMQFNRLRTVSIMNEINKNVTLVICESTSKVIKPSYEFLLAILHQIPIITSEWLKACITVRTLVNCEDYFIIGTELCQSDVVRSTQINKYKLNPKLFNGCNIFISKSCDKFVVKDTDLTLNVSQMRNLITVGGGMLLKREPIPGALNGIRRPWHTVPNSTLEECTHYVLYDQNAEPPLRYNMRELKHVPYQWVFESIFRYLLVPPEILSK